MLSALRDGNGKGGEAVEEFAVGCQLPAIEQPPGQIEESGLIVEKEDKQSMIKVGQPASDFKAPAFYQGKFITTSLADYKGKWVVLCFYPGDFTFV